MPASHAEGAAKQAHRSSVVDQHQHRPLLRRLQQQQQDQLDAKVADLAAAAAADLQAAPTGAVPSAPLVLAAGRQPPQAAEAAAAAEQRTAAWKAPLIRLGWVTSAVNNILVMLKSKKPDAAWDRALRDLYSGGGNSSNPCQRRLLTPQQFRQAFGAPRQVAQNIADCFANTLGYDVVPMGEVGLFLLVPFDDDASELARQTYRDCASQFGKWMVNIGEYVTDTVDTNSSSGSSRKLLGAALQQQSQRQRQQQQRRQRRRRRMRQQATARRLKQAEPAGRTTPYLTASRLSTVYSLPTDEFDGRGVNVAVASYERINDADVWTYLQNQDPRLPYDKNGYGAAKLAEVESSIDDTETLVNLELLLAVAPRAKVQYFIGESSEIGEIFMMNLIANNLVWDGMTEDVLANMAHIVLYTWQRAERPTDASHPLNTILKQMAMQGMTFITASGNCGSRGYAAGGNGSCNETSSPNSPRVGFPQNLPHALAVGGTSVSYYNSGQWAAEKGWSNSGGGVSSSVKLPWWQQGLKGLVSRKGRNLPDVALSADLDRHPYLFVRGNVTGQTGGTTAAASVWAGFFALVNQCRFRHGSCKKQARLGLPGPDLYRLGALQQQSSSSSSIKAPDVEAFHDVTRGTNGLYHASAGWDAVTGWGSMNGRQLLVQLCPGYLLSPAMVQGACCQRNKWTGAPHCFVTTNSTCTEQGGLAFHPGKTCGSSGGSGSGGGSVDGTAASCS